MTLISGVEKFETRCRNENFACETHNAHALRAPSTRAAIALDGGVADTAAITQAVNRRMADSAEVYN